MSRFHNTRIVLGVTGSIAAYKAVSLLRALVQEGADVHVVMTASSTKFVSSFTFEILSQHSVHQDLFSGQNPMSHLRLTESADLVLVAPSTAHTLAKGALGLADDLLSTMILAARCPLVFAPAMDGEMWEHPTVREHTQVLRSRGVTVMEPEEGPLASGLVGKGRFPAEEAIVNVVASILHSRKDLVGQRLLISAGPTREPIDPVRFITNGSSGKMGYALAEAAVHRGAEVVLVSGPTQLTSPSGVECVSVQTTQEMHEALTERFAWATMLCMTAAVGDFRPRQVSSGKIKKHDWDGGPLELERTPDILKELSGKREHQILVGFAAETQDLLGNAQKKLHHKNLDLVVVNQVGGEDSAFGNDSNQVTVISKSGEITPFERMPKRMVADHILDEAQKHLSSHDQDISYPRKLRGI
jgi:phosphopantothenoylcysteine decarboxylase/phosphopantothenate--cysteine ligase